MGSNDLTGEQGDDRVICIIDANTGSKKNDHDGYLPWTQPVHLTTALRSEHANLLHDPTSDAFVKIKSI